MFGSPHHRAAGRNITSPGEPRRLSQDQFWPRQLLMTLKSRVCPEAPVPKLCGTVPACQPAQGRREPVTPLEEVAAAGAPEDAGRWATFVPGFGALDRCAAMQTGSRRAA